MAREMKDPKREGLRLARELRERMRKQGEFTQAEFRKELTGWLMGSGVESAALEGFYDLLAKRVDDDATTDLTEEQLGQRMFPFDLDGEYKLGDGRRIAKRLATVDHARVALGLERDNLTAVQEAYDRKEEEFEKLRPYWKPGVTKSQAVAAWRAAQQSA